MGKKSQQVYQVKEIVDRRDEKLPNGKSNTYYKVVWKGYPESQATWESSRKLMRYPGLKKDVILFNDKRKSIIKAAKTDNKPSSKKKISQSFSIDAQKDKKSSSMKKSLEPATAIKLTKSEAGNSTSPISSKEPKKSNDKVVGEILSKIRENINLSSSKASETKKNDPIILQKTDKKIMSKVKERISALKDKDDKQKEKEKQKEKQKIKKTQRKSKQPKQPKQKKTTSQSIANIFPEPKIKLPHNLPEFQDQQPILEENKQISPISPSTAKPMTTTIEQPLPEQSVNPLFEKSFQASQIVEKIKLQLTEEYAINEAAELKPKPSDPVALSEHNEDFDIKGMIMCKNEYYYLVEENGKTQIVSRAEILNSHPYELIVFYEKRINIKPAEINMMVL